MPYEWYVIMVSAVAIGSVHTVSGPDHYLPFIALAKARSWTKRKMILWTLLCGCAHVWSSIFLAMAGSALGWSLSSLTGIEKIRGGLAGWALLVGGLLYTLWGLHRAGVLTTHRHFDMDGDGTVYVYQHREGEPVPYKERHKVTPWILLLIFMLGPCEPMIPLLFLPAVQSSWMAFILLVCVYTLVTLAVMVCMVMLGFYGLSFSTGMKWNRYLHAFSGLTIFLCGAGMVWWGW